VSLQTDCSPCILPVMVEIRLDAVASSISCLAGIVLAIDALTVRWKTKVVRGWTKLFEGLEKTGDENLVVDSAGKPSNTARAGEDWADRRTRKLAVFGFLLLAGGFALDIFSKVVCNPLIFSK
jgi:hypothetical protein